MTPPTVTLKSDAEIESIRRAGAIAAGILRQIRETATTGMTTADLDAIAAAGFERGGAEPLFLGYSQGGATPFPANTCISVNEQIVHGIPGDRVLQRGDVVSVDVGLRLDGWCADTATTFIVDGEADHPAERLIEETRRGLETAVREIRPGRRWSEVGAILERMAFDAGYGIVTEYVGHGLGRTLHEPPKAPAYATGFRGDDFELQAGMVLAVEPMLTIGRGTLGDGPGPDGLPGWRTRVKLESDGWTVVTADGSIACHEEHTIAVTSTGCEVLTRPVVEISHEMR